MLTHKLTHDLSAFEAKLSEARPVEDTAKLERLKTVALLEMCRTSQEKLHDTIRKVGEPEVSVTLKRFVRMERIQSLLIGLLIGLIIGVIINVIMMFFLVKNLDPDRTRQPDSSSESVSRCTPEIYAKTAFQPVSIIFEPISRS
ncbi:MAG: hypothetical protein ACRC2T_15045 [Thermoguttaceae bacterium]